MEVGVADEGAWGRAAPQGHYSHRRSWGSDSGSARGLPVSVVLNDTPRTQYSADMPYVPGPQYRDDGEIFEAGGDEPAEGREGCERHGRAKGLWGRAGRDVVNAVKVSMGFRTLREMCDDFYVEPDALRRLGALGEGGFAVVDKCEMSAGGGGGGSRIVAVKRIKREVLAEAENMEDFVKEYNLMKNLRNKSIVEVIGVGSMDTTSEEKMWQTVYIVQEYMDGGSLHEMVLQQMRNSRGDVYTKADAFRWFVQVAEGLAYMHERIPSVIHRDLKLENILLKGSTPSDMQAKVTDFGLATLIGSQKQIKRAAAKMSSDKKSTSFSKYKKQFLKAQSSKALDDETKGKHALSGRVGSLLYMAPEVFHSKEYNEKVDVFSFAIIMYEVLRARITLLFLPMGDGPGAVKEHAQKVSAGFRPPFPKQWPKPWTDLISDCWAENPEDRPPMSVVLERLKLMVFNGIEEVESDTQRSCCCVVQ